MQAITKCQFLFLLPFCEWDLKVQENNDQDKKREGVEEEGIKVVEV